MCLVNLVSEKFLPFPPSKCSQLPKQNKGRVPHTIVLLWVSINNNKKPITINRPPSEQTTAITLSCTERGASYSRPRAFLHQGTNASGGRRLGFLSVYLGAASTLLAKNFLLSFLISFSPFPFPPFPMSPSFPFLFFSSCLSLPPSHHFSHISSPCCLSLSCQSRE